MRGRARPASWPGKNEGKERYDNKHKPRNPNPKNPEEDTEYDFETWEHAKHRLEEIDVQNEDESESENNVSNKTLFSVPPTVPE